MGCIKKIEVLRLLDQMDVDVIRVYVAENTPLVRMGALVLLVRSGLELPFPVVKKDFTESG